MVFLRKRPSILFCFIFRGSCSFRPVHPFCLLISSRGQHWDELLSQFEFQITSLPVIRSLCLRIKGGDVNASCDPPAVNSWVVSVYVNATNQICCHQAPLGGSVYTGNREWGPFCCPVEHQFSHGTLFLHLHLSGFRFWPVFSLFPPLNSGHIHRTGSASLRKDSEDEFQEKFLFLFTPVHVHKAGSSAV